MLPHNPFLCLLQTTLANTVFIFFVFQVPVHVFLDFSTLECKHLSEFVELFVLDLMDANANYTHREVKVRVR